MSRPVIQLHTIEQWFAAPKETQDWVLRNLKVRDRLWSFIMAREQTKAQRQVEAGWVPCEKCDKRGHVWKENRKTGIHPSALGTTCMLKVYNEAIGLPQNVQHEARVQLIFDLGSAAHNMLQDYGRAGAWGDRYVPEVSIGNTPLAKSLMIEGHADADNILVIDESPDVIVEVGIVHEYKTINDNGYENLKNRPMPKHKQQAVIYSACLNRPVVVYLYFNKNNSNIQDFPLPFDNVLWEQMAAKAATVQKAVIEQTPPAADVGYHCKECGYVYQCEPYKLAKGKKA